MQNEPDGHREMLIDRLRALQEEYQARAKPIIDQLVKLESLKPPRPIILPADMVLVDLPPRS